MYPERLEKDVNSTYFSENEFFTGEQLVHTYVHKDYSTGMHAHEFYEINIIAKGEGRHYIENSGVEAYTGDIFVIPPEVEHGYRKKTQLDIYHILIKSDFFKRYRAELTGIEGFDLLFNIEPQIRRKSGKNYNLSLNENELGEIIKDLKNIKTAEMRKNYVYENILTLAFVCKLSVFIKDKLYSNDEQNCDNSEIIRLMDHIKNNFSNKITLKEIAAVGNISTATLNRRFREALNMSPTEYLIKCRVIRAKELLRQGEYNKAEIAQMCGFYDSAHLNKYMQKYKDTY